MPSNGARSITDDTFIGDVAGTTVVRGPFGRRTAKGTATSGAPLWERVVLAEIDAVLRLKQGWDSYSARPVPFDAGMFALIILRNVMQPSTPSPQVVPSSVGGIQLEWHERGIDLELHITGPYECELWFQDHNGAGCQPISEEITNDFTLIQALIADLTSRGAPIANATAH